MARRAREDGEEEVLSTLLLFGEDADYLDEVT